MKNQVFLKLSIFISILLILFTILYIPQHMDEYIMYNSLACSRDNQVFNIYGNGCNLYPVVLGSLKYNLSFIYVGISSSLFLAPFQKLFDSIWTQYYVGILTLFIIALGTAKSFKIKLKYFPLTLIFFPILYSVLRDGGPIRISLICISWSPFFFRKYLNNYGLKKLFYFLIISISWIISTEDKPFFIYLIPGTILLMISSLDKNYFLDIFKRKKFEIFNFFSLLTSFCILFLYSLKLEASNKSYLIWLKDHASGARDIFSLSSLLEPIAYTIYWPRYFTRIKHLSKAISLDINNLPVICLSILIAILTIKYYAIIFKALKKLNDDFKFKIYILSFSFLAFNLCILYSGGRYHHHYVFAQYPVLICLLLVAKLSEYKAYKSMYITSLTITFLTFIAFQFIPQRLNTHKEIPHIFDLAIQNSNESTIVNCSNWGCYYNFNLSNKNKLPVVFADSIKYMKDLSFVSNKNKKNILHLCQSKYSETHLEPYENEYSFNTICNQEKLKEIYSTNNVIEIQSDAEIWKVFKIDP